MKVKEVNIGNGIVRLEVQPSCACERCVPTHVVDSIIRDVIMQKNARNTSCNVCEPRMSMTRVPKFGMPTSTINREPDGIDVHVDRPLRENFRSHMSWADAMAKYRTLEMVAKECDWECKEPMQTLPNYRNFSVCRHTDEDLLDELWVCGLLDD